MELQKNQNVNVRMIQTIFWVLFFAQLVFFTIGSIIVSGNPIQVSDTSELIFKYFAPILAFLSILAGLALNFFSARKLRQSQNNQEKLQKFLSMNVIGWACLEGAVFISVLGYLITGIIDFQIITIGLMLFYLFTIPTKGRIAFALKISREELDKLSSQEIQ